MTDLNRFYVYAYLRKDGTPYYVGKGCGDRINRRHGTPGRYWKPPVKERRLMLAWGLTEAEALRFEQQSILFWGRATDGGILTKNFNDGGASGNTGWIPSEETKQLWSEQRLGRKASAETKAKMSETRTGMKKAPHTEETKARISSTLKGIVHSKESNQARSATMTGRPKSAEHVAKVSAALAGRTVPEQQVMRMRMSKGKKSAETYGIPACLICMADAKERARFRRANKKGLSGQELLKACLG